MKCRIKRTLPIVFGPYFMVSQSAVKPRVLLFRSFLLKVDKTEDSCDG